MKLLKSWRMPKTTLGKIEMPINKDKSQLKSEPHRFRKFKD